MLLNRRPSVNEAVADKDRVSETFRRNVLKSNDSGQGNAVHCLCTVHADGPPKMRDSKLVSLSLVKKKKVGIVLVCNEQNACVGLGRLAHGFCSQSVDQKNSAKRFFISFSSFSFRWM